MSKVFIGGSRAVLRLSAEVEKKLESIVDKGFSVIVGDANGADTAAQVYLHGKNYSHVEVFCSEGICRNNVGKWTVRSVAAQTRERNAEFYYAKDRAMAEEADCGLMLWDGKSTGTPLNVFRLLSLQKKAVVYSVPQARFLEFTGSAEWKNFMTGCSPALRQKIDQRVTQETPARRGGEQGQQLQAKI
jgi:hypothetical protein